jgi:hypothetical protein
VDLEVRTTRGSVENFSLLQAADSGVDVGLIQAGIGRAEDAPHLVELAGVSLEPLWVFCRGSANLNRVPDLRGRRLAVGLAGSATRMFAESLLQTNGLSPDVTERFELSGIDGADALLRGLVDCQFLIGAPEAGIVKALSHAPSLTLMNFERAGAYTRHMHFLTVVQLPEGVIDLQNNIPDREVTLLAAPAQLVARDSLHPAIQDLLLMAAMKVHGRGNLIQRRGEFPRLERIDFPVSDTAERFFRSGQSLLQRHLPFWLASLVDRFLGRTHTSGSGADPDVPPAAAAVPLEGAIAHLPLVRRVDVHRERDTDQAQRRRSAGPPPASREHGGHGRQPHRAAGLRRPALPPAAAHRLRATKARCDVGHPAATRRRPVSHRAGAPPRYHGG